MQLAVDHVRESQAQPHPLRCCLCFKSSPHQEAQATRPDSRRYLPRTITYALGVYCVLRILCRRCDEAPTHSEAGRGRPGQGHRCRDNSCVPPPHGVTMHEPGDSVGLQVAKPHLEDGTTYYPRRPTKGDSNHQLQPASLASAPSNTPRTFG